MKALYNVNEAAAALSVGRSKLYELMDSGAIQSIKIGQRRLVPVKCIDRYVATMLGEA